MNRTIYWKTGFTGGGSEDLDGRTGTELDTSHTHLGGVFDKTSGEICWYYLDQTSGSVADGYNIIAPAVDPGTKRWILLSVSNVVKRITANTYIYVSTTGDDSTGDGTSLSPYATLYRAWQHVMEYSIAPGVAVTIKLLDGTYITGNVFVSCNHPQGDQIYINGNDSNHTAVDLRFTGNGIATNESVIHIKNLAITGDGSGTLLRANGGTINCDGVKISNGYYGCHARYGGTITLKDSISTGCNTNVKTDEGSVVLSGSVDITSATFLAIWAEAGGVVRLDGTPTVTISTSSANSAVYANKRAVIDITSAIMTGTVTGAILNAKSGGTIIADSVDATGASTSGSYDVLADDFSSISIASATGFSALSPTPAGTVGNNNSIIAA